ncbi:hypothetical protein OF83DRAFT_1161995 [Amylostereum chailletii]|nr:hypothetical protein OF83DRAFT_1161995 [Amylostereum chailletii]
MPFDSSSAEYLKPWLTRTLEPICDADPDALADYILALLKHNAPEVDLRKELTSQLEEFLEKEGPPFIDTLFIALRTKSYLPYSTSTPPPGATSDGIPIPLDGLLSSTSQSPQRGRKRTSDYDDDGRPTKGPRLSGNGEFSRYGPQDGRGGFDGRSNGHSRGNMANGLPGGMPGMMNDRGVQQYRPPDQKRGICRDYHNNGYCARGIYCKYSHGEDAVVPTQLYPMNGQQMPGYMPMFNGMGSGMGNSVGVGFGMNDNGGSVAYDPHESRMELRPMGGVGIGHGGRQQRAPVLPRRQGEGGVLAIPQTSGELPVIQDLTPRDPQDVKPHVNGNSTPNHSRDNIHIRKTSQPVASGSFVPPPPPPPPPPLQAMDVDVKMDGPNMPPRNLPQRGLRPMRGRGAGRPGTFGPDVQRFRPERRTDKTLVVEKIPEDKLSLDSVNGWFKKFGTVTNVAIDARGGKALVSFSNHEDAHAAWKSEDAVFGNRFVKVFWHRPMEGHGQAGQKLLAASAPVVANLGTKEIVPMKAESRSTTPIATQVSKPSTSSNPAVSALAAKQKLLERQISEQKTLMEKLKTASPEEKKELFARLRALGEEMKQASSVTTVAPSLARRVPPSIPRVDEHERSERDRLDKELEMHSSPVKEEDETTEGLQAKLARLKAEAASLGIDPNRPEGPTSYRPYRGRGRGRGFRGGMRGGPMPSRGSMKLDNRPKKLLVKDVDADSLQAVRDWFETTGQVDAVDAVGNDAVISFRTRNAAEQGLAKGTNIPLAGQKQISWYTTSTNGQSTASKTATPNPTKPEDPDYDNGRDVEVDHHIVEDEVAPIGWGDDTEDGMGML